MNGEFRQSFRKYILAFLLALAGVILTIRFALWGVQEISANRIASSLFCFTFSLLGTALVVLSIFILHFNRNASLCLTDDSIHAQLGWKKVVHIDLKNITNATIYGKHLKLYTDDSIVWIYGLSNAKEVCECLLSRIERRRFTVDINMARKKHQMSKKRFIGFLITTIFACAMLFVHIGWCVLLTNGKDLTDFSPSDNRIFIAFLFAEFFTVILCFLLADKCGKARDNLNMFKSYILFEIAQEHKDEGLDKYHNVILKKYFDHYTYRIIIFSPYEEIFAYMLERFDIKTLAWLPCYEHSKAFEILSELYDDLEQTFEGTILED